MTEAYKSVEGRGSSLRPRILCSIVIFCLTVPLILATVFSSAKRCQQLTSDPPRNVVRDLIFCLVIPWDLWMKRTIKIQNVFLGGGFQNWSLWGSHPLGYWISSLCNVEKAVWWKLALLASPKKQTSSLFKVKHTHWGSLHHFFKWMKTSQAELMKCRISANRLHPSSFGHKERWSANSPQRTLPV